MKNPPTSILAALAAVGERPLELPLSPALWPAETFRDLCARHPGALSLNSSGRLVLEAGPAAISVLQQVLERLYGPCD